MINYISVDEFLEKSLEFPMVDVRSPGEYLRGHIPGAISLPLFDDLERAKVGTTYKQIGKDEAILQGLEFVGPKMAYFAKRAKELCKNNIILIHCWRGGMRSESMAWLFTRIGIKCFVLKGGYKAYRNFLLEAFNEERKIIVVGGLTGSGKTDILKSLEKAGEQVLHLEELANHKGSSFGSLGQRPQPTIEHFENLLYSEWRKFDSDRVIWLEDESKFIGRDKMPDGLWFQIRNSVVLKVNIPIDLRIKRLVDEYAIYDKSELVSAIERIKKRIGDLNYRNCITALNENNYEKVVEITLQYYDKTYLYGLSNRQQDLVIEVDIDYLSMNEVIEKLIGIKTSVSKLG